MPTEFFLDKVWLIPLFPLAGAALMLLAGKRLQNSAVSVVCVGSVFVSFVFSLGAVWQLLQRPAAERVAQKILFEWVPAGLTHTSSGKLVNFVAEWGLRSEEHTSELQSRLHLVCRLLLEKKKRKKVII